MRLFVQIQAHGVEFENALRVLHFAVSSSLVRDGVFFFFFFTATCKCAPLFGYKHIV